MRAMQVIGNWKMHGRLTDNAALLAAVAGGAEALHPAVGVGVCVPFPYLAQAQAALNATRVVWGAQDLSAHERGAFTGEVAASMLADFGARCVLVGHSERRQYHGESDAQVAAKARRALEAGLAPVVCVGETLAQRQAAQTDGVVAAQIDAVLDALTIEQAARLVVAYEPVWAIGTGLSATAQQAQDVHALLRGRLAARHPSLAAVPLLYGGSVKPANAQALFAEPDIDGGLIGGASLQADEFLAICRAADALLRDGAQVV